MGKADDLRRLREARFAQPRPDAGAPREPEDERPAEPEGDSADAPDAPHAPDAPARTRAPARRRPARELEQGACATCGKLRPLQRGLVAPHQKGLGKVCPGSRKPPA
ncbi:MAG: hypothetical protein R3B48_11020 [Kofleriaceae bacterium]